MRIPDRQTDWREIDDPTHTEMVSDYVGTHVPMGSNRAAKIVFERPTRGPAKVALEPLPLDGPWGPPASFNVREIIRNLFPDIWD